MIDLSAQYDRFINMLSDDLIEVFTDQGKHPIEKIRQVVQQVMNDYKKGLEASKESTKDFLQMRVENWDAQVLDPLTEVANVYFTLDTSTEQAEQKEEALKSFFSEELIMHMDIDSFFRDD